MISDIHDASMKMMFDYSRTMADLLRGFIPPDLTGELEFSSLEQVSSQFVGGDLKQSRSDMIWRIRFRRGGRWLYLFLLLEFQSRVDRAMALRINAYTAQLYTKLFRSGKGKELPLVLPVVIYDGRPPWSAARGTEEMVAAVEGDLAPYQLRQSFFLIDVRRLREEDLPEGNVLSLRVRLAQGLWSSIGADLRALGDDPEVAGDLARLFGKLLRHELERGRNVPADTRSKFEELAERGDLKAMESLFDTAFGDGRVQGLAVGRKEGREQQRMMLMHLTALKFDAGTASRLEAFLADVDDPERLVEIGSLLIASADGEEFLSRLASSWH